MARAAWHRSFTSAASVPLRVGAAGQVLVPLVRPCRNRYCPEYGDETGWCPAHRQADVLRAAADAAGVGGDRGARSSPAFPWCQDCGLVPATEVHHVVSRAAGGGDEPGNLRSLCHSCHATITGREGGSSWP